MSIHFENQASARCLVSQFFGLHAECYPDCPRWTRLLTCDLDDHPETFAWSPLPMYVSPSIFTISVTFIEGFRQVYRSMSMNSLSAAA